MAVRGPQHVQRLDALRAIAVASVLAYHLAPQLLPWGFLGVDLFFGLSGFLMGRLILAEHGRPRRQIVAKFCNRRFWRIGPPLILTLLGSLVAAMVLMSPGHLEDAAVSAVAALLSVSNFYFFAQAGYFDTASVFKPLLHTWSLGVEVQFYLLLIALLVVLPTRLVPVVVVGLGALSFGLYVWVTAANAGMPGWQPHADPLSAVFYLTPYRIFQFAAGMLAALVLTRQRQGGWKTELAGFGMLGLSLLATGLGLWAAATPVLLSLGAGLLMLHSAALDRVGRLGGVQYLARISYHLYLTHWPVIVFCRYLELEPLGPWAIVICLVISLGLAMLLFRMTEPMRHGLRRRRAVVWPATAVLVLGAGLASNNGSDWRIPHDRRHDGAVAMRTQESAFCDDMPVSDTDLITCRHEISPEAATIYVWGDSHARHLIGGLAQVFPDHNIRILYFTSCLAQSGIGPYLYAYEGRRQLAEDCVARNRAALQMFADHPPTAVILHQYFGYEGQFSEAWFTATDIVMSELRGAGHAALFLGGVRQPGRGFADCRAVPALISDRMLDRRCAPDPDLGAEIEAQNDAIAIRLGANFIVPDRAFCLDDGLCQAIDGGTLLFRDGHHLSVAGAERLLSLYQDRIEEVLFSAP